MRVVNDYVMLKQNDLLEVSQFTHSVVSVGWGTVCDLVDHKIRGSTGLEEAKLGLKGQILGWVK